MKQLLLKIFILLLIIFSVDRIMGTYLDSIYESNFNHYSNGHLNYYLKTVECDTLLLGSSRIMDMLNPEVFGKNTYTIGQPAKHLGWCASVLDLLEQNNKLPKRTLLINIEPEDFNPFYNGKLKADIHYLKYYYNDNAFIRNEIKKASPYEFLKYFSSCFRHNGDGLILMTNPLQNIGYLPEHRGFIPLEPTPQDSVRTFSTIETPENNDKLDFKNSSGTYYFNHIINICRKHNLELIVITAPYFRASKYTVKNSEEMQEFLRKKNVPYLNYLNTDIGELKNLKFWFDNTHLNSTGATIFSKKVKSDIQELER